MSMSTSVLKLSLLWRTIKILLLSLIFSFESLSSIVPYFQCVVPCVKLSTKAVLEPQ